MSKFMRGGYSAPGDENNFHSYVIYNIHYKEKYTKYHLKNFFSIPVLNNCAGRYELSGKYTPVK